MTCQTCIHRLDVSLWGLWLATGCRVGLVIRGQCDKHQGPPLADSTQGKLIMSAERQGSLPGRRNDDKGGDISVFARATESIPESVAKWLPDTVIADEVEKRIGGFASQPPVVIRDTAFGVLPGVTSNDNVAGAVHDGTIHLFRDNLANGRGFITHGAKFCRNTK